MPPKAPSPFASISHPITPANTLVFPFGWEASPALAQKANLFSFGSGNGSETANAPTATSSRDSSLGKSSLANDEALLVASALEESIASLQLSDERKDSLSQIIHRLKPPPPPELHIEVKKTTQLQAIQQRTISTLKLCEAKALQIAEANKVVLQCIDSLSQWQKTLRTYKGEHLSLQEQLAKARAEESAECHPETMPANPSTIERIPRLLVQQLTAQIEAHVESKYIELL